MTNLQFADARVACPSGIWLVLDYSIIEQKNDHQ